MPGLKALSTKTNNNYFKNSTKYRKGSLKTTRRVTNSN